MPLKIYLRHVTAYNPQVILLNLLRHQPAAFGQEGFELLRLIGSETLL